MGRRQRRRSRDQEAAVGPASSATTDYADTEGNVLTLRDELSPRTIAKLGKLDARAAESVEDRYQRREEFLFERLVVRWEIAGLPLESQKELLGRYRMASAEERRFVRETLEAHLARIAPDAPAP